METFKEWLERMIQQHKAYVTAPKGQMSNSKRKEWGHKLEVYEEVLRMYSDWDSPQPQEQEEFDVSYAQGHTDGYQEAKRQESRCWSCDAPLDVVLDEQESQQELHAWGHRDNVFIKKVPTDFYGEEGQQGDTLLTPCGKPKCDNQYCEVCIEQHIESLEQALEDIRSYRQDRMRDIRESGALSGTGREDE